MFRLCVIGIAFLFTTGVVAGELSAWEDALKNQLMKEEQCQLSHFTNLKVTGPENRETIKARAHCADGRAFDINSQKDTEKFELHACGPVAC